MTLACCHLTPSVGNHGVHVYRGLPSAHGYATGIGWVLMAWPSFKHLSIIAYPQEDDIQAQDHKIHLVSQRHLAMGPALAPPMSVMWMCTSTVSPNCSALWLHIYLSVHVFEWLLCQGRLHRLCLVQHCKTSTCQYAQSQKERRVVMAEKWLRDPGALTSYHVAYTLFLGLDMHHNLIRFVM